MVKVSIRWLDAYSKKFRFIPNNDEFVTILVDLNDLNNLSKSRIVKLRKIIKVVKTNYRKNKWIETFV